MENGALLGNISRLAQGMPKGPAQEEHARRPRSLSDLFDKCQRDRCYTRRLDFPCEQSHGSRADGSGRHKKHQVNVRVGQAARNLFAGGKQRVCTFAEAKAKVLLCHLADEALCLQFTQALQREDEVVIA